MQKARAITKFVRISPYKARKSADLVRGKDVEKAQLLLAHANNKGARLILKTLKSAIANAQSRFDARKDEMIVDEIRVDGGPTLKRSKARNKGGQSPINKRTSHFTIVVATK